MKHHRKKPYPWNNILLTLVVLFTLTSCQTTAAGSKGTSDRTENDWPQLSQTQWRNMTPTQLMLILQDRINAPIDATDKLGNTALFFAAELNSNPQVIQTLIQEGADIAWANHEGITPLHVAAGITTNPQIMVTLLEAGADPDFTDTWGRDPISLGILANPSFAVIATLLQAESEFGSNTSVFPWPKLNQELWQTMTPAQIQTLVEEGNSPTARTSNGRTGLHFAAQYSLDPLLIERMISLGFSLNSRDARRWTPALFAAVFNPSLEVLQLLSTQTNTLDPSHPLGYSVLHFASLINSNHKIIEYLVQVIGTGDIPSVQGVTPIMAAAWGSQQEAGILGLLASNPSVRSKDKLGRDILNFLRENPRLRGTPGYWLLMDAYYSE